MSPLRLGFIVSGCLALGFVLGWQLHQPAAAHHQLASTDGSSTAPIHAVPPFRQTPNETEHTSNAIAVKSVASPAPSVAERLAALRWLKNNGLYVGLSLFSGDRLSPEFSTVYGLTPTETAQIDQAYQHAKRALDELTQQRAQLDPGSTADKLIVTVPAFPTEGGSIYNNLVAAFSGALGSERYSLFNSISGESLAHCLGSFGVEDTRYEVIPSTEKARNGSPLYTIQRSFSVGEGIHRGTSGSFLDAAGVAQSFPLLKRFPLPSAPSAATK